ncbi:MAG: SulP family inorganic anion transporter [Acidimicrobiia bacterium]
MISKLLPRRADYAGARRSWRADLFAGVTVGVVALPLALGFGITTGLGASVGVVTAIVAGVVAAVFGGSNVQVSGPTGAMTVVLVPIVAQYGKDGVLLAGIMAGLLVLAASVGRLGRALRYVPWPVIEGFTLGIAVLIFLQQVPNALGVAKPEGENAALVAARAIGVAAGGEIVWASVAVVAVVVALMAILPRVRRDLPGSLVAVVVATVIVEVLHLQVALIGSLPDTLPTPSLPTVSMARVSDLLGPAFAIAALAAIESLLSAKVADGMADTARSDPDRELFGQGLANVVAPIFGGMPATGAIARTAVNVRAGARTRVAAIVHSLVLLLVVLVGSSLVAKIPLAALAGVLMATAWRMVDPHNVRAVVRATRGDALVLAVTATVTIAFDLILAVEVGVAVAAVLALRAVARSSRAQVQEIGDDGDGIDVEAEHALLHDHIVVYRVQGSLFFGAAQQFLAQLTAVTDVKVVILRLADINVVDATGAAALEETVAELERRGITVLLKGVRPEHQQPFAAVGTFRRLAHERHVFDDLGEAIEHARAHVRRDLDEHAA